MGRVETMFNKIAKTIRWTILLGMLYTLYSITIKDSVEFTNQTDEKILVQMAKETSKSKDLFKIREQLTSLFPNNEQYKKDFKDIVKQQANKLLDAHEKMLLPHPIGNYRYVQKVEFGKDKDGKFVLILNLTEIFDKKLDIKSKNELKKMFFITHHGIYEHYGFDKNMRLILSPTYDNKKDIEILDLERVYEKELTKIPSPA